MDESSVPNRDTFTPSSDAASSGAAPAGSPADSPPPTKVFSIRIRERQRSRSESVSVTGTTGADALKLALSRELEATLLPEPILTWDDDQELIAVDLDWEPVCKDLVCRLPSGRPLYYRDIELAQTSDGRRPKLTYASDGGRTATYGGKLVENIVQATARDILAAALVALERASIPVVLHVHDEIVCEVAHHQAEAMLEKIRTIAAQPPTWASDLPLSVSGFTSERYRK